jgi:hypothetical protein
MSIFGLNVVMKYSPVITLIIESTCSTFTISLNNMEPTIIVRTNFTLLDMLYL